MKRHRIPYRAYFSNAALFSAAALFGAACFASYSDQQEQMRVLGISALMVLAGKVLVEIFMTRFQRPDISESPDPFSLPPQQADIDKVIKDGCRVFRARALVADFDKPHFMTLREAGFVVTGGTGITIDRFYECHSTSESYRRAMKLTNMRRH